VTLDLLRGERPVLRVGHRGAAALAPENTIAAFEAAVAAGVDGVEFDVVAGPRGLEVAHDSGADDAPSLDAALAFFAAHEVAAHVDLKAVGHERELVEALRSHGLLERSLVSSFRAGSLRALADIAPELARSFTYPEDRLGISRRRPFSYAVRGGLVALRRVLPRRISAMVDRAQALAATLHYQLVTRRTVEVCHARGAAVWAWTVNDPDAAARLEELGVDAIITDDPRIFRGGLPR
jgi:glycerophosphoryl diester phosphodiesterase